MNAKIRGQITRRKWQIARRLDRNDNRGCERPMMTAANIHYEIAERTRATAAGGVGAMHLLVQKLGLDTMIDRYLQQPLLPTGKMLAIPLLNMFIALVGALIVIALLARYLPRTNLYRRFALFDSNPPGPSLTGAPRQFATALALTPGMQGTAVTVLRPSGKARFADHLVDVVTEGEFIARETPVTVIQTDGMRVVVKSAAEF